MSRFGLTITEHAAQRITERDIPLASVVRCLERGFVRSERNGKRVYALGRLRVVVCVCTGEVITAFRRPRKLAKTAFKKDAQRKAKERKRWKKRGII
jgi:hypothetical protein